MTDLADIAKAATYGMVNLLLADLEVSVKGSIDEIVKRSLACGAKIMVVRKNDMIGSSGAAVILRYSL